VKDCCDFWLVCRNLHHPRCHYHRFDVVVVVVIIIAVSVVVVIVFFGIVVIGFDVVGCVGGDGCGLNVLLLFFF